MPLDPTPEQRTIIDFALNSDKSLLISALAGAAKTSTLVMICEALPSKRDGFPFNILSLAFNKRIALEMTARLPSNVQCKTLNALGHGVWQDVISKRLKLETDKTYKLLTAELDKFPKVAQKEFRENFAETKRAISSAKLQGYIPAGAPHDDKSLISAEEFFDSFDEEFDDIQRTLVDRVLKKSIEQGYAGTIDFDDQIYLPTLFGGSFPRFPLILVDEAQDLSPLNHAMLDKLVIKRLIAVGDSNQSIYGFRSAMSNSMTALRERFSMVELPLSVSFRCPRSVVEVARKRAPTMTYPEWAAEGEVSHLSEWTAADIPDGATIICRNNAPLFKLAIQLIKAGRGIKLAGSDVGPGLIKILKKLGPETLPTTKVLAAIDAWETAALSKSKRKASVSDRADCLRIFAQYGETLSGAIAYAERLFSDSGPVQLSSIHKVKGLEFDTVYMLDRHLMPSKWSTSQEELEQEENLWYVGVTRAKKSLYFVTTENFIGAPG